MHKTTLYLPEDDIIELKRLALDLPKKGLTYHIQKAVKQYIKGIKTKKQPRNTLLLKCRGISKKTKFGDPVTYQRRIRDEWGP